MSVAAQWYSIFVELANNDITKIEAVTNLGIIEVLNFLQLKKMKEKWKRT